MSHLKKAFFSEYGGFADKRIKNLDKGSTFIIDDRSSRDIGADRRLYSYFCAMFADVSSDTQVHIRLVGNVPLDSAVRRWMEKYEVIIEEGINKVLSFSVSKGEEDKLRKLADAIASIVAPGVRYSVSNYKYVCPRTAKSLRRLADTLAQASRT
jgi:hypothetical protein